MYLKPSTELKGLIIAIGFATAILPSQAQVLSGGAQASDQSAQLEILTTKIAKKETELLRLNTNFRVECTRVSKWKSRRLAAYNLAASGVSNAGITNISVTRWHFWPHPKNMHRATAKVGPTCLLIGHCITLGGVLTESAWDVIKDHKVRSQGFDIKTTHNRVLTIKQDLDKLIADRNTLLATAQGLTSSEQALAKAEGAVLKDVRDLSLNEYAQFFVRAHKFFGSRETNSLMAVTAASTGGFQGSLLGIISAANRQPRLVGPGGLGFLLSGAAITATPGMSRLVGTMRGNHARKTIASEIDNLTTKSVSKLDEDKARLQQLVSGTDESQRNGLLKITQRLSVYNKESILFAAQDQMNAKEKALAKKEFIERSIAAASVGGTKMSWGINLANAGFRFHPRSKTLISKDAKTGKVSIKITADPRQGQLFTRRVAIGATTYIPGTGVWMIDTLQNRIRGEMRDHSLAAQNKLPGMLLKERFDRIDDMDSSFNY